jgi:Asp-tRNA(Asn)/Glu-tRNA(Gln) amidotransferase A subunit family amidase
MTDLRHNPRFDRRRPKDSDILTPNDVPTTSDVPATSGMPDAQDASRRRFLVGSAAALVLSAGGRLTRAEAAEPALISLGAADAVAAMARGDITAEHYAAALLQRCHDEHALNAFITLEPQRVLAQARACDQARRAGGKPGPLFGLPIPVKDSVNTMDYPTTGGTPALRHFRPSADAPVVAALKAAGAIVLGKTNLHELSYGWTSNNLSFGAVHNPYDLRRIPGGSSGGTAAAVAAHCAPLGVAEDTEGSIRVPAAFCGLAGFRPTTGRYPTRGCIPITPLFDQVGPLARCVADLALFDSAVAGDWTPLARGSLRGVRLGVVRDYWFQDLDPEVARIAQLALRRLEDAGVVLVEGNIPELARLIGLTTVPIQDHDVALELAKYLQTYAADIDVDGLIAQASPDIRDYFRGNILPGAVNRVTEAAYGAAVTQYLPELRRRYRQFFADNDVAALVFPATMVPPPLIGEETQLHVGNQEMPFEVAVARNIAPGSTAGLPGLVLPAGLTAQGLPVALEFDGPAGADRALLALGQRMELVLGRFAGPPKAPLRDS